MKKPKPPKNEIEIFKNRAFGGIPLYIGLGQRHFEKEQPTAHATGRYKMPVDLAGMVLPVEYVEHIESIELLYERRT